MMNHLTFWQDKFSAHPDVKELLQRVKQDKVEIRRRLDEYHKIPIGYPSTVNGHN